MRRWEGAGGFTVGETRLLLIFLKIELRRTAVGAKWRDAVTARELAATTVTILMHILKLPQAEWAGKP
ncbi:hypothetical protein GCM10011507_20800 [Edaphobacter acidisoli]|uniref:Uncharacterized protein n=1 Tax=Edaphobacter acidisoli TaxID=2040573 RepID=A0A916RW60_9BACT|nr:hypothetical protein GCM10011507_20800 [Edaphobacter acidisoli]